MSTYSAPWGTFLHHQLAWAWQAGALTLEEARTLNQLAPWETEETVDEETAALIRRYLWWLRVARTAQ